MKENYTYEQILAQRVDFKQHKPISKIVYAALKQSILDEIIPLGERINEYNLSNILSISRTPIRRAIKLLCEENLLEYIPDYGVIVKNVSLRKTKEIFRIRISLEIMLYESVYSLICEDTIEFLSICCENMLMYESNNQIEDLIFCFNVFNTKIHETAQLSTVTKILDDLSSYINKFRSYSFVTKDRRSNAVNEHCEIVKCLRNKDWSKLKEVVVKHIEHAEHATISSQRTITPEFNV